MDRRSKDFKSSHSEWSFKLYQSSLSAQRPLAGLKNMKAYPKNNPCFNQNNNSLKYLKLAPINSFSELSSPQRPSPVLSSMEVEKPRLPPPQIINRRVSRCAFHSQKGQVNGFPKEHNQDNVLIIPKINDVPYQFLFGVFDGHGALGHSVSSLIKSRLKSTISSLKATNLQTDIKDFLDYSINLVSQTVLASTINTKDSGSTLCTVVVAGNTVVCANVGDSMCVLVAGKEGGGTGLDKWRIFPLSKDHKPCDKVEADRIVKCGGIIDENPFNSEPTGVLRVWSNNPKIPGLSMTRSIGDTWLRKVGVISDPEIISKQLTKEDKFIILASDGLWDIVSELESAEIVSLAISDGSHAKAACQALVEEATRRWKLKGSDIDDISVIVILLNDKS